MPTVFTKTNLMNFPKELAKLVEFTLEIKKLDGGEGN
jgi:hypothetical protein